MDIVSAMGFPYTGRFIPACRVAPLVCVGREAITPPAKRLGRSSHENPPTITGGNPGA